MGQQLDQAIGKHTIEWGADIRRAQQKRIDSSTHRAGEVTFNESTTGSLDVDNLANGNATTGSGVASFLLGYPVRLFSRIRVLDFIRPCDRLAFSFLVKMHGGLPRN